MTHTAKQGNRSADETVTRVIPIETTLNQAQLQVLAAKLDQQTSLGLNSLEVNRHRHLIIRYDAAIVGFTQVLLQLQQLSIKVRDSRWFQIKTEWVDFVDNNVASHANTRPKLSCNRMPRI